MGYGDAYPVTLGGRIWTFVVLLPALPATEDPAGSAEKPDTGTA